MRVLCIWAVADATHSLLSQVLKKKKCVCSKQSSSYYVAPTITWCCSSWTMAGLCYMECGVYFKECVSVCVHVYSRRLCVYVQYAYIYWLV